MIECALPVHASSHSYLCFEHSWGSGDPSTVVGRSQLTGSPSLPSDARPSAFEPRERRERRSCVGSSRRIPSKAGRPPPPAHTLGLAGSVCDPVDRR